MNAEQLNRFLAKTEENARGCIVWTGARDRKGYGLVKQAGKVRSVHRVAFEHWTGPIPAGLTIDHLCRERACVNPLHLECVTNKENILRGFAPSAVHARKNECIRGHKLPTKNNGRRECRACARIRRTLRKH